MVAKWNMQPDNNNIVKDICNEDEIISLLFT